DRGRADHLVQGSRAGAHRLPRPARGRVPRLAARDDGRKGAAPGALRRRANQARGRRHRSAQHLVNPIYWDLGAGIEIRTHTPDDAEAAFALVQRNRDRLHPWMLWEPQTKTVDDT